MECIHCHSMNVEWRKTIRQNGSIGIGAYCLDCNRRATVKIWHSNSLFSPERIDAMPIESNYTNPEAVCCVEGCTANDVEWHHFAPKHLFGMNSDRWPAAWVCRKHHSEWHQLTRTGSYHRPNNGVTNG